MPTDSFEETGIYIVWYGYESGPCIYVWNSMLKPDLEFIMLWANQLETEPNTDRIYENSDGYQRLKAEIERLYPDNVLGTETLQHDVELLTLRRPFFYSSRLLEFLNRERPTKFYIKAEVVPIECNFDEA